MRGYVGFKSALRQTNLSRGAQLLRAREVQRRRQLRAARKLLRAVVEAPLGVATEPQVFSLFERGVETVGEAEYAPLRVPVRSDSSGEAGHEPPAPAAEVKAGNAFE